MHELPQDWTKQLIEAYPARSGPCGWGGMRLMLSVRRALNETSWERIMEGVRGYAQYARESGKEGSEFIVAPKTFFDDAIYLEQLTYKVPENPQKIEARAKEQERMDRAVRAGSTLEPALFPMPGESAAAFETRIMLAQQRPIQGHQPGISRIGSAVTSLKERMRMAK
jgi:hypothetical protein